MSFSFSQSLLDDMSSPSPSPVDSWQDMFNSQDSGYAASELPVPLSQPGQRSLPSAARAPLWPVPQLPAKKWMFPAPAPRISEKAESSLLRDLQHHLTEILAHLTHNIPSKMSVIVTKSVNYLESVSNAKKETSLKELSKLTEIVEELKISCSSYTSNESTDFSAFECALDELSQLTQSLWKKELLQERRLTELLEKLEASTKELAHLEASVESLSSSAEAVNQKETNLKRKVPTLPRLRVASSPSPRAPATPHRVDLAHEVSEDTEGEGYWGEWRKVKRQKRTPLVGKRRMLIFDEILDLEE